MSAATTHTSSMAWPARGVRRRLLGLAGVIWLTALASALLRAPPTHLARHGGFGLALAFLMMWAACFMAYDALSPRFARRLAVRRALIFVETGLVLASFILLRDAFVPALLVVVAAQLPSCTSARGALICIFAASLALFLLAISFSDLTGSLTVALAYLAFQYFSLLLSTTLMNADQARAELAAINARLVATQALLEDSVRERERLRITRDLHDLLGHKLTALQLNLQVAGRILKSGAPGELDTARRVAGEILSDIRNVVAFVPVNSGVNIDVALTELANAFPGSLVRVEVARNARVDDLDTAQCILRCAQEATSNAIRHGHATDILIAVTQVADEIVLSVRDDGAGMLDARPGFGLSNMESRVRELGGRLELLAVEPQGTDLRLIMPASTA